MKVALLSFSAVLLVVGCGAAGGDGNKPSNTAGSGSGGQGAAGEGTGGMAHAGSQGQSGSAAGGKAGAGNGGASAGTSSGGDGGSGGSSATSFSCPAGPFEAPKLTGTPKRVEGVPPSDTFNNDNNNFSNIEGDVWIGDALYVSEIVPGGNNPPPSRVLKITATDQVSIAIPDSGSNGLAVDSSGQLFGALHKDGSISKLSLAGGAAEPVAGMFMNMRFDSPNDLAIHSNGTIYFSDPDWQAAQPRPQAATRAYRIPPGGQPEAIEVLDQPNGISLSPKEDFLYIGGNQLKRYPVMADGSLGTGTTFVQGAHADGMAVDCAGNLYTAANAQGVIVYDPSGAPLGTITVAGLGDVTNVAFGGTDHKTLYISGQGGKGMKGLFKLPLNVPGFPY